MVAEELGPVIGPASMLKMTKFDGRMEGKQIPFVDVYHPERRRRFQSGSYRHVQTQPTPKPQ